MSIYWKRSRRAEISEKDDEVRRILRRGLKILPLPAFAAIPSRRFRFQLIGILINIRIGITAGVVEVLGNGPLGSLKKRREERKPGRGRKFLAPE